LPAQTAQSVATLPSVTLGQRLTAHLRIARFDHSVKQVFILPGIVLAFSFAPQPLTWSLLSHIAVGCIAATLIACSNYVLNEMLDAPFDRLHPTKKNRPAACGLVHFGWGYAQWIAMMVVGLLLAATISRAFLLCNAWLWVMGCIYNIPPVRSKDLPYVDALSESVNNPIRFCLGWYIVAVTLLPPASLLISYWMLGAYFMGLKRFSEYRQIGDPGVAASYRRSFAYYTEPTLLNSVAFYAAAAMLFLGAFIMRYHMELILSFPAIAWLMAQYFGLSFRHESAVQNPEKLYREPRLMIPFVATAVCMCLLLFVHIPLLARLFIPTAR
jgi:4-hydroxybenzoate polyprenyltransferase